MTELVLVKTPAGSLVPASDQDADKMRRFKVGNGVRVEAREIRNYPFHKKFFALLGIGFDAWEPPELEFRGLPVMKNFERFRKDCLIAAGFYETTVNLKGEVRAEALSISFANMEQDEFEKVYSAVVNVLLERVLTRYTRADLDDVVERVMRFT